MNPCLNFWNGCALSPDEDHCCHRPGEHEGRCRCAYCGATTTRRDPIFDDPLELEEAQEALE